MIDEKELAIHPVVQDSVQHNARVGLSLLTSFVLTLSNIRNLTASLFGIAAGVLGLESYPGFIFYLLGTMLVSALIWAYLAERRPPRYFASPMMDVWVKDVLGGLSSFVLTWTLFFGLVRA
ncbi:MAG: hypothetical protein M1837_004483 [Sclerophora amabilis]|nr:MAG: hypothetical protein M1837_004483 [Sclerophora amabilis]